MEKNRLTRLEIAKYGNAQNRTSRLTSRPKIGISKFKPMHELMSFVCLDIPDTGLSSSSSSLVFVFVLHILTISDFTMHKLMLLQIQDSKLLSSA
jgi:hypothetical protein